MLLTKTKANIPYTLEFMVGAMSNKMKIEESLYYSGVDKLDLIIDMELMLQEAKLTGKQAKVVELYFFNQYTQEEVSKKLGISQQAVLDHLNKVKQKINKVLKGWEKKDEKYKKQFNNR